MAVLVEWLPLIFCLNRCHMCCHLCFHTSHAKSSIQYMTQIVCRPSAYILYPYLILPESSATKQVKHYTGSDVRSCNPRSLVAHWRLFWQGGRTHSLAQPEWIESAPDLCSAPYAGQQFSAAPIPATAPDRQWATGAAYRFIKPQPKHTEPHPFPLPMKTTHIHTEAMDKLMLS